MWMRFESYQNRRLRSKSLEYSDFRFEKLVAFRYFRLDSFPVCQFRRRSSSKVASPTSTKAGRGIEPFLLTWRDSPSASRFLKRFLIRHFNVICVAIYPRLLVQGRFIPCLKPGYFLLQPSGQMHAVVCEHW